MLSTFALICHDLLYHRLMIHCQNLICTGTGTDDTGMSFVGTGTGTEVTDSTSTDSYDIVTILSHFH